MECWGEIEYIPLNKLKEVCIHKKSLLMIQGQMYSTASCTRDKVLMTTDFIQTVHNMSKQLGVIRLYSPYTAHCLRTLVYRPECTHQQVKNSATTMPGNGKTRQMCFSFTQDFKLPCTHKRPTFRYSSLHTKHTHTLLWRALGYILDTCITYKSQQNWWCPCKSVLEHTTPKKKTLPRICCRSIYTKTALHSQGNFLDNFGREVGHL